MSNRKEKYYTCGLCKLNYEFTTDGSWTEENALHEAKYIFGAKVENWKDPAQLVCDDCFKIIDPSLPGHAELLKEAKKAIRGVI